MEEYGITTTSSNVETIRDRIDSRQHRCLRVESMTSVFDSEQKRALAGRARTLFERLEHLDAHEPEYDEATVEELLSEWKELFPDEAAFERRLDRAGLPESDCRNALQAGRLAEGEPIPEWVERLETLVAAVQSMEPPPDEGDESGTETPDEGDESGAGTPDDREWIFGEVSAAVAAQARERLSDSVTETLPSTALDSMTRWFRIRFERRFTRILYVEFKAYVGAHDRDLVFADPSAFDPLPTDYYEQFVDLLFEGEFGTLCLQYPVFARLLETQLRQWLEHVEEFCGRLRRDREQLAERFDLEDSRVLDLEPLAEDTHGDGRAVMRVEFTSGESVVYKPRSVDAGEAFYEVLARFDDHLGMGFRTPTYLVREGYGWMEWIDADECEDSAAVTRYYRRAGALICLGYVLELTDCQIENVLAAGEYPILLDVETVLHPFVDWKRRPSRVGMGWILGETILLTSLLPEGINQAPDGDETSFSTVAAGFALEADEIELESLEIPTVEAPNSDVMAVEFKSPTLDRDENVPAVDGTAHPPGDYVDALAEGFERAYETILELRETGQLGEEIGIPDRFVGLENRVLYRPTRRYGGVLDAVRSRDCLRNGARFGIELESLIVPFCDGRTENPPWRLYDAERRALERGDPPRLTARTDETGIGLWGSETGVYADRSGIDRSRSRIASLDRADLEAQLEILRGSFGGIATPEVRAGPSGSRQPADDERFRTEARELLDRIRDAAVETPTEVSPAIGTETGYDWIATTQVSDDEGREPLTFHLDDGSLYTGRTGIAVFGAGLYRLTGEDQYREFTRRAVAPTVAALRDGDDAPEASRLGGTNGLGATAYGLGLVGELLDDPALLDAAGEVTDRFTTDLIAEDDAYGVINGSAGTILGLLALHDRTDDHELVSWAAECGEHLLANRVKTGEGRAWRTLGDSTPQTGFSHGASGIAYALVRLWDATEEDRYRDAALEALAYEDGTYSSAKGNWTTVREPDRIDPYQDKWCYGRSGIGLARLGMAEYLDDDRVTRGIERALDGVPGDGLAEHDHLCCGNAGRAAFLLEAQHRLGRREGQAGELLGGVLARKEETGAYRTIEWTNQLTKPSLFRGIAGIGYAMVRVTDPESLPCLLLWE